MNEAKTCKFCGINLIAESEMFGGNSSLSQRQYTGHSCRGSEEAREGQMLLDSTTEKTATFVLCKYDDWLELTKGALKNGYGLLPAKWAISLYLARN